MLTTNLLSPAWMTRGRSAIAQFLRIPGPVRSALRNRKGVSAAEYAILAVGVVIVVGGAVGAFGGSLADAFTSIGTTIADQQSSLSNGGSR